MTLLTTIEGDQTLERELHQRFADHRLNGEWFEPVDELLLYIASHS
ncbi:MAG: GIY-YIG nuclease family protein [Aggregatilineales bacterium]